MTEDVDKHIHDGFQFIVTQVPLTIQISEKVVKEHRLHKYAWMDLLLKRQMTAQEGAKEVCQDTLLEKRTSLNPI